MKKSVFTIGATALVLSVLPAAQAQTFGDILRGVLGTGESENSASVFSGITSGEAEAGLKQALTLGAEAVGRQLSARDGYFGDRAIQIPLPGRMGELQSNLKRFGLSGPLDDLQLRMNRAAEDAAPYAADLVVDAVQSLTIDDALALLNGGDTAATDLLRDKTEYRLSMLVRPYVESALADSGALSAVDSLSARYGVSQLGGDVRESLIDHAVDKGLDGLFIYLAKEEQSIRNNPVERTTDLLRRVFGG